MSKFAMSFPAINGDVVTQGHADYCAANGHATHKTDGVVSPFCPRCGDALKPVLVIGTTARVGGIHAADYNQLQTGGFAPALCRSSLLVLVDHRDGIPVTATATDHNWREGFERPSCLRCVAALERIGQ